MVARIHPTGTAPPWNTISVDITARIDPVHSNTSSARLKLMMLRSSPCSALRLPLPKIVVASSAKQIAVLGPFPPYEKRVPSVGVTIRPVGLERSALEAGLCSSRLWERFGAVRRRVSTCCRSSKGPEKSMSS